MILPATSVPVLPLVSAGTVPATAMICHEEPTVVSATLSSPIPDMLARCLSPGPTYDGPEPDPALMVWPLSANRIGLFLTLSVTLPFDTVVLRTRSPSPLRECDDSFSAS